MKTKLEMAHDYAMLHMMNTQYKDADDLEIVQWAFDYADAMQAEMDKRKKAQQVEYVFEAIDEWQPDWSQAPEWANWLAMDKSGQGVWHNLKPSRDQSMVEWVIDFSSGSDFSYKVSLDFNYTGDWRDSLRKRPQ